jgi:hypothetical protein
MDPDAGAYITAVETADAEPLEERTKIAIDNFVLGCKADGIWPAIKASCILAGARTLAGALVPLVGAAPTNVDGLFVSGDYNRKTGLVGNGSTKRLDCNYNDNNDLRTNRHRCIFVSEKSTVFDVNGNAAYIGNIVAVGSMRISSRNATEIMVRSPDSGAGTVLVSPPHQPGFMGFTRSSDSEFVYRNAGVQSTHSPQSVTGPTSTSVSIHSHGTSGFTNGRVSFYSLGEILNLAIYELRVNDLINAFDAAIP